MNVYLYQSGTEKILKSAYIGEVYEYSYDFRGKTTTNLSNDGWSWWSSTPQLNSNGLYCTSSTPLRMKKGGIDLTNAKKLTLKYNGYLSTSNLEIGFRVAKITSSNSVSGYSGTYIRIGSSDIRQLDVYSTGTSSSGATGGTYTAIAEFDFVNKTSKASFTGYSDITHTLTDTEISNIKSNTDSIFIYMLKMGSSDYISDISITVEY